jgi:zinc protease
VTAISGSQSSVFRGVVGRTRAFAAMIALGLSLPALVAAAATAEATTIERVKSPGGIEAWLVREPAVPLIEIEFAFAGGAVQDPLGKSGTAELTASLLDDGAGDLDAAAFHERLERKAIELSFSAERESLRGSLRTLTENRDEAFECLRLALTAPRFDSANIELNRAQILAMVRRQTTSPADIASRRWWETAFPGHPYGRSVSGTLESLPNIAVEDIRAYSGRVLARDNLKIAVVGDIDAEAVGIMLARVFGALPEKAQLSPIANVAPGGLGQRIAVKLDVPQTVVNFGGRGIGRKDPDFMAAYIVNQILGGGSFSSRLYQEVREKRGLAYSVSDSLVWLDHAAMFLGGTATRADRSGETVDIIEKEVRRLAEDGPTADELAKAKAYLKSAFVLNLDTSGKIATLLVQLQLDDLGIDYIARRADMIDAVTLDDARRVAKRLLDGGMLITMVGRPEGVAGVAATTAN